MNTDETVKLPLWKNCLEAMIKAGVEPGQTYKAEFFEEQLRCKRDTMEFGLGVSEIRQALEHKGLFLSGRGLHNEQFAILRPEENRKVSKSNEARASKLMRRGTTLLANTDTSQMSADDKRKHDQALARVSIKSVLLARYRVIAREMNGKLKELKA